MKDRWQKSIEAAVADCDIKMPWERGAMRQAMIARREADKKEANKPFRILRAGA